MRRKTTAAITLALVLSGRGSVRAATPVDRYGRPLVMDHKPVFYRDGHLFSARMLDGSFLAAARPSTVPRSTHAPTAYSLGAYQSTDPGSWPEAVAIGDVTGDGRSDVVMTTTYYTDPPNDYHVFVYPQLGNGTLGAPTSYPYGFYASKNGLALADLDEDGRLDVVVGHGSGISVLLQNGSGGLNAAVVTSGDFADVLSISDVDLDGHLDVISLGAVGATLRYGDGTGGFRGFTTFTTTAGFYSDMEMVDVSGDGYEDLGVASLDPFSVYRHDGIGALSTVPQTFNLSYINYLGLGDINGDGLNDGVVSGAGNRPVDIYLLAQDASGNLTPPTTISSYDIPEPVVVTDIDGNGLADVIVAHGGWQKLGIYLQGAAGLQPEDLYDIPYASHYSPVGLAVGDINGDGCNDVAIADYNSGLVTLLGGGCSSCGGRTLSPYALPGATIGVPYSQTLTVNQGTAPFTFNVIQGALPAGLALSPSGNISGTPAGAGVSRFTIKAVDAAGCPATKSFSIRTCGAISLSPPTLPSGTQGSAYSQTVTASGGAGPYAFAVTAGNVPAGTTLSAVGVLSGTPTVGGVYGFTVAATDSVVCTGSRTYTLVIACPGCSGAENIIAGGGLGQPNANNVRVYTQDGTLTPVDFLAYSAGQWGVNVASGNTNGAALDQILTGPGPGPVFGPQVRAFASTGNPLSKVNFYAYGTLKYGVNLATTDLENDGFDEILTGAGPGAVFGPHVRGFNFDNANVSSIAKISFFAYSTLRYGANVGGADVDGDSYGEIVTGPGPGVIFGPQVRGFNYDGTVLTGIGKINFSAFPVAQYGANVAGGDADADSYDEIACSQGPGAGSSFHPRFLGFNYDGSSITPLAGFDVTVSATTSFGGRVGFGDVTGDGTDDLLSGEGRDAAAASTVQPFAYGNNALAPLLSFDAFTGQFYGVNVAGGDLGY